MDERKIPSEIKRFIGILSSGIGVTLIIIGFILFSTYYLGIKLPWITQFVRNLFSRLFGSAASSIALPASTIIMFILGLFSILLGSTAFLSSSYSFLSLISSLVYTSAGIGYIISSFFIFKSYDWARRLSIFISTILLFYFLLSLCLTIYSDPSGWGKLMLFLFSPYVLFLIFFIIFLTRSDIKAQFKK